MPRCHTKEFGELEFDEAAVVHFAAGLPAFDQEKRFLLIERSETAPVVFLQSLTTPHLLFLALPVRFVDPTFRLKLADDERAALGLPDDAALSEGEDLVSLALLTIRPGSAVTANLLAPVVIAARSRRALQVVQPDSGYRVDHQLGEAAASCS